MTRVAHQPVQEPVASNPCRGYVSGAEGGQEDQLGSLGLVVNIVVLWNTIYMDAALDRLRAEGYEVRPEDVARLSPLGHSHVNMLGRYTFTPPEAVARGELRPLRDPHAIGPDDP